MRWWCLVLLGFGVVFGQSSAPVFTERPVGYEIDVFLDTVGHKLVATQTIRYQNQSPDLIGDLQFHLYQNAFRNNRSTYFFHGFPNRNPNNWGYVHVQSLSIDGVDRSADIQFPQLPQGGPDDRSVLKVDLQQPLAPGESVLITMSFETQLSHAHDRNGYGFDDFYFAAQWFPKLGVWETRGMRGREQPGWNAHAFHWFSEFYANFADYAVTITVPKNYIIGSTGVERAAEDVDDTLKRYRFEQDRVHDFAFAASPNFLRRTKTFVPSEWISEEEIDYFMARLKKPREEIELAPIEMILLIQPEHSDQIDRHFRAMAESIKWFGLRFGRYPYETITMIDPSRSGARVGGMEYPTLVTLGTDIALPRDDLDLESVTAHEFGHQYWYGTVATNEFEEAWLDEGFTTFTTVRMLDDVFGHKPVFRSVGRLTGFPDVPLFDERRLMRRTVPVTSLFGLPPVSFLDMRRHRVVNGDSFDPINKNAWSFYPGWGFRAHVYSRAGVVLWQLERELGDEIMDRVLRTYAETWKFRHPNSDDFQAVAERVSGRDLGWFFERLIDRPWKVDFAVGSVTSRRVDLDDGYQDPENEGGDVDALGAPVLIRPQAGARGVVRRNQVVLENRGNTAYPIETDIHFDDGSVERVLWNGEGGWRSWEFVDDRTITKVVVDPDHKLVLETLRSNNTYMRSPEPEPAKRWSARLLLRAQHVLQFLGGVL